MNHHVLDELPGQPEIVLDDDCVENYALQAIRRFPTETPRVVRMRMQQLAYELHRERQITSAMLDAAVLPGHGKRVNKTLGSDYSRVRGESGL